MTASGRVVCKVRVKTVADRRARRIPATVPLTQSEFSVEEQQVFQELDRRHSGLGRHKRT